MKTVHAFVLECYWPGVNENDIDAATKRLEANPGTTGAERVGPIAFLAFPDDDVVFFIIESEDAAAAQHAAENTGIRIDRIARCQMGATT